MKQLLYNRNEVFQQPSPRVLDVLKNFNVGRIQSYLEGYYSSLLIPKISTVVGVPESRILIGYGIEDFLRIIFDRLDPKTDTVLTQQYHYAYYEKYLEFKGVKLRIFKMKEQTNSFLFDIEDCVQECQKLPPRLLLLTSPNNPTGNSLSAGGLEKILRKAGKDTLVVVDEAYWGFDPDYDAKKFISLLRTHPRLVLLRSLSKRYALAGLRIGLALCGSEVKNILQYQNRYLGLSRILEEVAIAALESEEYYNKLSQQIIQDRKKFIKELSSFKNFIAFDSKANFVLIRLSDTVVPAVTDELAKAKVVTGKFVDANLLRVTVGNKKHTDNFLKSLAIIEKRFPSG